MNTLALPPLFLVVEFSTTDCLLNLIHCKNHRLLKIIIQAITSDLNKKRFLETESWFMSTLLTSSSSSSSSSSSTKPQQRREREDVILKEILVSALIHSNTTNCTINNHHHHRYHHHPSPLPLLLVLLFSVLWRRRSAESCECVNAHFGSAVFMENPRSSSLLLDDSSYSFAVCGGASNIILKWSTQYENHKNGKGEGWWW